MIAFKEPHPLVRFDNGQVIRFDPDWLEASVIAAATAAGYEKWWLAEHVTESVTLFLERDFHESFITINGLSQCVSTTLQVIGYTDVAHFFTPLPPPCSISLVQIARSAGYGYELLFFTLLKNELRGVLDLGTQHITIEGLQPCVKQLRHAKNWRNDCDGLRDEIVQFVRNEIDCTLSSRQTLCIELT